jgi:tetratricopeptide (TPR) repeat protein
MSLSSRRALRQQGKPRVLAAQLAAECPADALVQYEAACVHDCLGREREAVPYYLRAIASGLPQAELRGAYLGLGSTYRVLGRFDESLQVLDEGRGQFPAAREFEVFRAMTLHNLGRGNQAVEILLQVIAETSSDPDIQEFSRAIALYAEDIERNGRRPLPNCVSHVIPD